MTGCIRGLHLSLRRQLGTPSVSIDASPHCPDHRKILTGLVGIFTPSLFMRHPKQGYPRGSSDILAVRGVLKLSTPLRCLKPFPLTQQRS